MFKTVTDLIGGAYVLRRRPYGVIEAADGRFRRILLRPFPNIVSFPHAILFRGLQHRLMSGDRAFLYYNQPRWFPNFLVLKYIVSGRQTSFATLCRALAVLDEIARLKGSDALLCDVRNQRISRRLLARYGWQPHCPSRWHRHYIKRFYGQYPPRPPWVAELAEPAERDGAECEPEAALVS